ncbi:hypothetical protein VNO80_19246 [Phaseolus coccineus]|uniref:Uncharacterized protein n=1 Tax=Phaseolus coccineus TaxID=3886 RepID=A0AAN9R0G1_PHACN
MSCFLQVVGDVNVVKDVIANISSRLRESQHRDQSHFYGRVHSPERFFSPDNDYIPHVNSESHRSSVDGVTFGSRGSNTTSRSNNHSAINYLMEPGAAPVSDDVHDFYGEELNEVGVNVKVTDPIGGLDEQIVIITSEEGPDDELFPTQEALLQIKKLLVQGFLSKGHSTTSCLAWCGGIFFQ